MQWQRLSLLIAGMLFTNGCLGTLVEDRSADLIAGAAQSVLDMPIRASRPYWLLRQQPNWISTQQIDFGGAALDRGRTSVYVVRFRTTPAAVAAFQRLTPDYFYRLWAERMREAPRPMTDPPLPPVEQALSLEYRPPLPRNESDTADDAVAQLIALRSGAIVLVIDSIGVDRQHLASAATELIKAARGQQRTGR